MNDIILLSYSFSWFGEPYVCGGSMYEMFLSIHWPAFTCGSNAHAEDFKFQKYASPST